MPKGKKSCPKCGLQQGIRVRECECGHNFMGGVPALETKMELAAVSTDVPIASNISSIKPTESTTSVAPKRKFACSSSRLIVAPAGPCPIKPRGYKERWPDGPASDDVVTSWAEQVFNYSDRYSVEAVVYWARSFWDINSKEFVRISGLIYQAIATNNSNYSSEFE